MIIPVENIQARIKLIGRIIITSIFLFILFISQKPAAWFEQHYSRGLYPKIAGVLVPFGDRFPFSLSLVLLGLLVIVGITALIISWKRKNSVFGWALFSIDNLIGIALLSYILFFGLWGANYKRLSVEKQFNLADIELTQADVDGFLDRLEPILTNFNSNRDQTTALNSIDKSLKETIYSVTGIKPILPRIKKLPKGSLIFFGNSSGISSPFFLEAHVDAALSDTYFLRVAAHELAHTAGYAGEADADFISELALLRGSNEFARYSVAMDVYISILNMLEQDARAKRYQALPERVKNDIRAIYVPFKKYAPPEWFQSLQKTVYGSYLKSQGVSAGYADYSRDIKLLLVAYKQGDVFK